jgi:hypothetical protein
MLIATPSASPSACDIRVTFAVAETQSRVKTTPRAARPVSLGAAKAGSARRAGTAHSVVGSQTSGRCPSAAQANEIMSRHLRSPRTLERTPISNPSRICKKVQSIATSGTGLRNKRANVRQYFGPALRVNVGAVALASPCLMTARGIPLDVRWGVPADRSISNHPRRAREPGTRADAVWEARRGDAQRLSNTIPKRWRGRRAGRWGRPRPSSHSALRPHFSVPRAPVGPTNSFRGSAPRGAQTQQ